MTIGWQPTVSPPLQARCPTCAFGRATQRCCDIFGTPVTTDRVCRSYRLPGESHGQARATHPTLERLHTGIVYEVEADADSGTAMFRAVHRIVPVTREEPATALGDKWECGHAIEVLNIDGSRSPAQLNRYENGLLVLIMRDLRYAAKGDPWSAIREIRAQMAIDGRIPLVNGSNRNAYIAGMAYQFGEGTAIYLVHPDGIGSKALVVDPLAADHVTDPVYPAEQEKFAHELQEKWWSGNGDPPKDAP